jgi:chromosome segregation ATPase
MENQATSDKLTRKDLLDLEERLTKKLATREAVDVLANQVLKNTDAIDDIKTELQTINLRIDRMQVRIEKMDDKIDRLDEKLDYKFNIVLNAVDNVLKEITNNRTEKAAYGHALTRHEGRLENHEKRINILEREAI